MRLEHEPGCPAIYDDESDQVLHDYQECACENRGRPMTRPDIAAIRARTWRQNDAGYFLPPTREELAALFNALEEGDRQLAEAVGLLDQTRCEKGSTGTAISFRLHMAISDFIAKISLDKPGGGE